MIVENIGELVTMQPLAKEGRTHRVQTSDLGLLHDAWLEVENGRVIRSGTGTPPAAPGAERVDAQGELVTPGLVDSHTHPLFAGIRHGGICCTARWGHVSGVG